MAQWWNAGFFNSQRNVGVHYGGAIGRNGVFLWAVVKFCLFSCQFSECYPACRCQLILFNWNNISRSLAVTSLVTSFDIFHWLSDFLFLSSFLCYNVCLVSLSWSFFFAVWFSLGVVMSFQSIGQLNSICRLFLFCWKDASARSLLPYVVAWMLGVYWNYKNDVINSSWVVEMAEDLKYFFFHIRLTGSFSLMLVEVELYFSFIFNN